MTAARRGWIIAAATGALVAVIAVTATIVLGGASDPIAAPNAVAPLPGSAESTTTSRLGTAPPSTVVSADLAAATPPSSDAAAAPVAPTSGVPVAAPVAPVTAEPERTKVINIAAVDAAGNVMPGFSVSQPSTGGVFGCDVSSPASVGHDIHHCAPTAASANVCWAGADDISLLCGDDPWSTTLRKVQSDIALTAVAPAEDPSPWGVELRDGSQCLLRNGGAWPQRDDGWIGVYLCEGATQFILASDELAVDKTAALWTVQVGELGEPAETSPGLVTMDVVTAYFADTAPAAGSESIAPASPTAVDPENYRAFSFDRGAALETPSPSYGSFFSSPSGNIHCAVSQTVTCQIIEKDFASPAKPAGCENHWADDHVTLDADGAGVGICIGGAEVPGVSAVLPYGSSLSTGGYVCSSAETGITCTSTATGRGFTLRKASFDTF